MRGALCRLSDAFAVIAMRLRPILTGAVAGFAGDAVGGRQLTVLLSIEIMALHALALSLDLRQSQSLQHGGGLGFPVQLVEGLVVDAFFPRLDFIDMALGA